MTVKTLLASLSAFALAAAAAPSLAAGADKAAEKPAEAKPGPNRIFQPAEVTSTGTVTIDGKPVAYQAVAGTLVVHPDGWDDVHWREAQTLPAGEKDKEAAGAEASMFYTAYFKQGGGSGRPVMFIYNGGPGSATLWLHMAPLARAGWWCAKTGIPPPRPIRWSTIRLRCSTWPTKRCVGPNTRPTSTAVTRFRSCALRPMKSLLSARAMKKR